MAHSKKCNSEGKVRESGNLFVGISFIEIHRIGYLTKKTTTTHTVNIRSFWFFLDNVRWVKISDPKFLARFFFVKAGIGFILSFAIFTCTFSATPNKKMIFFNHGEDNKIHYLHRYRYTYIHMAASFLQFTNT